MPKICVQTGHNQWRIWAQARGVMNTFFISLLPGGITRSFIPSLYLLPSPSSPQSLDINLPLFNRYFYPLYTGPIKTTTNYLKENNRGII